MPVRVGPPPPAHGPTEIELIAALYADAGVRQALARHGLPAVPPGGPIWQRFPVPARLSPDLAEELYVSSGIGVHHIELLTGQPADSVRKLLHAAGVAPRPAGGRSPFLRRWRGSREGLSSACAPWWQGCPEVRSHQQGLSVCAGLSVRCNESCGTALLV